MTRAAPALVVLALAACTTPTADSNTAAIMAAVFDGSAGTCVDLTHAFSEETVYWPTDTVGFVHEELAYGRTEGTRATRFP